MKFRLFLPLVLLAGFVAPARAELRPLASATSDSYQSLTYGISAFCQAAGFPFALTEINDKASELLFIPNLAGIDVQEHFWLFWLADVRKDQPATNLVSVAILPTVDGAATTLQALASAYPLKTHDDQAMILSYALPPEEAAHAAVPVLYVAVRRGTVIASTDRGALLWAIAHPLPAHPSGAPAISGQVRFEFQPATLAALAAEDLALPLDNAPLRATLKRLLSDIRTLSLTLETATEGVTLRVDVAPLKPSPLAGLFRQIRPPDEAFWNFSPNQSALAIASGGTGLWQIPELYGTNRPGKATAVLGDCLTGDRTLFIGQLADTNALYYAEIFGITNRAVAWGRALANPQALLPFELSFSFATNGIRLVRGTPVLDLARHGFALSTSGEHHPADMAAFMIRDGGVSLAATDNRFVVTFGATNAIGDVLQRLDAPPTRETSLSDRCRNLLPGMTDPLATAIVLRPTALVRQIAQALPGLRPEQIAALPRPGDGMAAATTCDTNGTLHLAIRVSANEVARLQEGMTRGHHALQELFMQMALQQILQQEQKLVPADPRNPTQRTQPGFDGNP